MRTAPRFHFVSARSRTFPPEDFLLTCRSIHLAFYKEKEAVRISLSLRFSSIADIRSMIYRNNENCTSISLMLHVGRGRSSYKENGRKCSSCASTSLHFLPFSLQFSLFFAKKSLETCAYMLWGKKKKHETGFEPAALALARRCSTTEPLVHFLFRIYKVFTYLQNHILNFISFSLPSSSSHFRPSG